MSTSTSSGQSAGPDVGPVAGPGASVVAGPVADGVQQRSHIGGALIERVISRSSAAISIVFALQALPALISQVPQTKEYWLLAFLLPMLLGLVAAVAASIANFAVKTAFGFVAIVLLAALLLWPLEVNDPGITPHSDPWLYYLCTVATGAAAVAFRLWIAVVYTIAVPIAYGFMRVTPSGGSETLEVAVLEGVYVTILGGAVLIIVSMLRGAAASVDRAQVTALSGYTNAVRQHATDLERVQVDAIVHDGVLASLLSGARAYKPEARELATAMASRALLGLRNAESGYRGADASVSVNSVVRRIVEAAAMVPARFVFKSDHIEEGSMPIPAADAIFSATVQAMTNSAEHASKNGEEVTRSISVSGLPGGGLHVIVQDDGAGFDLDRVSSERLGVRVSIRERVVAAGGDVEIDSAPGEGTRVSVSWQHPPVAERRDFDDDSELAAMSQNSESALAEVREGGA